jgi:TRAP-type mannitol/chloroaromatic compound transport system permease small subunit
MLASSPRIVHRLPALSPRLAIDRHPSQHSLVIEPPIKSGPRGRRAMEFLLRVSRGIDRISVFVGRAVAWLILLSIFVSAANATSRKLFDAASNAWLELQWYLFGAAFLLAAAYTLQRNEHIRIDIVSGLLPPRVRDWIDLLGHVLMLLPFTILMIVETTPFVTYSFRLGEVSSSYGGLIVWPAKALILVGFLMLFVQELSEIVKRIAVMRGLIEDPHRTPQPPAPQ